MHVPSVALHTLKCHCRVDGHTRPTHEKETHKIAVAKVSITHKGRISISSTVASFAVLCSLSSSVSYFHLFGAGARAIDHAKRAVIRLRKSLCLRRLIQFVVSYQIDRRSINPCHSEVQVA